MKNPFQMMDYFTWNPISHIHLVVGLTLLLSTNRCQSSESEWSPTGGSPRQGFVYCNRDLPGITSKQSPGDNGFKIKISGNPEKYVPGELYTVILQGHHTDYTTQKFTAFMLVVEPRDWPEKSPPAEEVASGPPNVGTFQLFGDSLTKLSDDCPNAVVHTSTIFKSEIQVMWQAPTAGSGCVIFKATLVENKDYWYKDDGGLTKVLCEEETESLDEQPEVLEQCCACEEAKYEVIFEGLWSKNTHPKDFPTSAWLTHFSDIIGASHSADFRMWEYGGYASEGFRQVAEMGVTKKLESELKQESTKIRTIIKARGLWHPNLNGKTFAVFRVDRKHHLMSLVSMLGPSPDWVVGVSALELCLKNCSWVAEKQMNLYLWDAGTDSGITYLAANQPTIPQERIRRITSNNPSNSDSPFYDPNGAKMKPFAKLTVTRQRMYEKPCDDNEVEAVPPGINPSEDENIRNSHTPGNVPLTHKGRHQSSDECQVTEWTEFGPCSATCGQGVRMRTRNFVYEQKARMADCRAVALVDKELCDADCVGDVSCATTSWSEWSECGVSCGKGHRTRSRKFMNRMARKVCTQVELVEREMCVGAIPDCPESDDIDPKCAVTQWSEWSPCTVTCGKGMKIRTRLYLSPSSINMCNVELIQKAPCVAEKLDCSVDLSEAKEICMMPKEVGPCRGYFPRWHYDVSRGMCVQFIFGGCRGNRNNFERHTDCNKMCEVMLRGAVPPGVVNKSPSKVMTAGPHLPNHSDQPVIDCVVTPWGEWSECSRTCGPSGRKSRRRYVKLYPQNGGKPCPKKLVQRRKCKNNPPCRTGGSL